MITYARVGVDKRSNRIQTIRVELFDSVTMVGSSPLIIL